MYHDDDNLLKELLYEEQIKVVEEFEKRFGGIDDSLHPYYIGEKIGPADFDHVEEVKNNFVELIEWLQGRYGLSPETHAIIIRMYADLYEDLQEKDSIMSAFFGSREVNWERVMLGVEYILEKIAPEGAELVVEDRFYTYRRVKHE